MKNIIITTTFILGTFFAFSQEKQTPDLLVTNWGKETFTFPLGFAREINYKGVEEARFSPEWSDKNKPGYWTYAFVWNVEVDEKISANELEEKAKLYFDGLLQGVNKDKGFDVPKTTALFIKTADSAGVSFYRGKLNIYDSFIKKEVITLNVLVESFDCETTKKSIVLFRFSPKEIEHPVWEKLKAVKVSGNICEM